MLFLFGYNFISTVLRALGDSRTPMRFVTIAVLLNIVLDPLFIAVFNLGIKGAAYAKVISQGRAFFYGFIYVLVQWLVPFSLMSMPSITEDVMMLSVCCMSAYYMD